MHFFGVIATNTTTAHSLQLMSFPDSFLSTKPSPPGYFLWRATKAASNLSRQLQLLFLVLQEGHAQTFLVSEKTQPSMIRHWLRGSTPSWGVMGGTTTVANA